MGTWYSNPSAAAVAILERCRKNFQKERREAMTREDEDRIWNEAISAAAYRAEMHGNREIKAKIVEVSAGRTGSKGERAAVSGCDRRHSKGSFHVFN
jgi:hypothetical protein